jgi:hypothetical protein
VLSGGPARLGVVVGVSVGRSCRTRRVWSAALPPIAMANSNLAATIALGGATTRFPLLATRKSGATTLGPLQRCDPHHVIAVM